jgi:subfamily B ATP-binding cassette protein MsbA
MSGGQQSAERGGGVLALFGAGLLWPHRGRLAAGLACLLLLAGAGALQAYLTGPLLQVVLSGGRQGGGYLLALAPWLDPARFGDPRSILLLLAGLLVALAAVKGLAHLGQALLLSGTAERIGHQMRVRLFSHLMRLPLGQHRRLATGDLLARLLDDVQRVQAATVAAGLAYVREGLAALALAAVAVWMAPRMALLSVVVLPLVALLVGALSRGVKRAARRGQEQLGRMSSRAVQGLSAIREVKSSGAEERETEGFSRHSRQALRWTVRRILVRALSPLVNELLASLALGAVLVYAGARIASGTLAPERFVSFFVALVLMYKPIKELGLAVNLAAAGRASTERVARLLALRPERRRQSGPGLAPLRRQLELRQVSFSYPGAGGQTGARPALAGVDLLLPVGRVVALAGPSGAGKTTLANLVCGLERPDAGQLLWDGEPLADRPLVQLREQVALVPQQPLLLDGSVADNLRYGCPDADRDALWRALSAAGLEQVVRGLPRGLQTPIGPDGVRLSAGEAQRLALARALLRRVNLLVLDEPASALDPDNEALLIRTLRQLCRQRAVLLVAHGAALLAAADEVLRLEGGRRLVTAPPAAAVALTPDRAQP